MPRELTFRTGVQDELILDLNDVTINKSVLDACVKKIDDTHASSITLENTTEEQIKQFSGLLENDKTFSVPVNLPAAFNESRLQIQCDNIISNHLFLKQCGTLQDDKTIVESTATSRILPEEGREPEIEITLYEEPLHTAVEQILNDGSSMIADNQPVTSIKRTPIAETVLAEILDIPRFKNGKVRWKEITQRNKAIEFRLNITTELGVHDLSMHPLNDLVSKNSDLQQELEKWTKTFALNLEQYDALLDVYGQYGASGLKQLFQTWNGLSTQNNLAFQEMFQLLLKSMPSYIAFISDPQFFHTLENINLLGQEKYSWWKALIQNHTDVHPHDNNVSSLFQCFVNAANSIEETGLVFSKIDSIDYKKDLPTTLSASLTLLKRCSLDDRMKQFECIPRVDLTKCNELYFIIPEMKVNIAPAIQLDVLKTSQDVALIKQAVYGYLATQKYHLPLSNYDAFLDELIKNTTLGNESKCKMAYILAKTTSTNQEAEFEVQSLKAGWVSFQDRFEKLESLDRMKANRSYLGRRAFELGLQAQGPEGPRLSAISPITAMEPMPPLSFLLKLLQLSEYKFLDENLSLTDLQAIQSAMMKKISEAALLCARQPEAVLQAIRLIKTETVVANKDGKYFPAPEDIPLLENFVAACNLFMDKQLNQTAYAGSQPQHILLPVLTVFHLEYERNAALKECIETYNTHLESSKFPEFKDKIQSLMPYALSLFQLVQDRSANGTPLNLEILKKIQNNIIKGITENQIKTRKDVRVWVNENYADYFEKNQLLDIKDEVNVDETLDENGIKDKDTREAITTILSYFNELDEEKPQLNALALDLIAFDNALPPIEKKRFYQYCLNELKTDGLLSRSKHQTPPGYQQQFQSLIQTLTKGKSIEAFEQFMEITNERVSNLTGQGDNSITKCDYLLNKLFPTLLSNRIAPKEAFQFSADLVCSSPVKKLKSPPRIDEEKLNNIMGALGKQIETLYEINEITPTELAALKETLHEITGLIPPDAELFKDCQRIIDTINAVFKKNQNTLEEYKKSTFLTKIQLVFSYIGAKPWEAELWEAGLYNLTKYQRPYVAKTSNFQAITLHLHQKKTEFIKKYNNLSVRAEHFLTHALRISPENPDKNYETFCTLVDHLIAFDSQNLVLSLMYHYANAQDERSVDDLAELLSLKELDDLNSDIKKNIIHAIVTQMNNGVDCKKETIISFIQFIHANKKNTHVLRYLNDYYQHAPFPSLPTFMRWTTPPCDETDIQKKYHRFDKNPCALGKHDGREKENGFKRDVACSQLKLMGSEVNRIFDQAYLDQIETCAKKAISLSTEEILAKLKTFQDQPVENHIELVMYSIEFLHRCKGRTPEFIGPLQKPGRSFELNTTQILAILAMLETGQKITAEIGTGEGKSRIMMILNACQFLKGNTVDFITSNLALAERDYLEALPFFNSLGANVSFITATSQIKDYQVGGINVSDPINMGQFRNKALSQKKKRNVLDPDPQKRTLLLDEADVTFFDVSNKKVNYSTKTRQLNIDILPLYPILMDFFAEQETEQLYREDKIKCNKRLLATIETKNPDLFAIIKQVPVSELEKWQDAAYIVRHDLKYNVHYSIVTDATVPTDLGEKKVAAAMCLVGNRINEQANFSHHVHQCLHAELNRLIKNPQQDPQTDDPKLGEALKSCQKLKRSFHLSPVRETTYTASSDAMLQLYHKGSVLAVTGSTGVDLEKYEAETNVGTKFLVIPRHQGLHRIDRSTKINDNEDKQLDALVEHILKSRDKNQPVLLMCKNDNQSQDFYNKLNARLAHHVNKEGLPKLTRVDAVNYRNGQTPTAQFVKEQGGKPGQVIVTTEILGRGIEYELKEEARKSGLKVLLTFLPKSRRDYIQAVGRSGRYGQVGETQMVLNLRELQQDFGIERFNKSFYANPEAFLMRLQLFSTFTKTLHRVFNKSFDDLLTKYTHYYDQQLTGAQDNIELRGEFLKQYQHSKEIAQNTILNQLEQVEPDVTLIENTLVSHENRIAALWQQHFNTPLELKIKKPALLDRWLTTMQNLRDADKTISETRHVNVLKGYESEYAGRMAIFNRPQNFSRWRDNLRAWYRMEGLLFPNFYAWRIGELSTRNYLSQLPFLNYIISPVEEDIRVKSQVKTSHAAIWKILDQDQDGTSEKSQQPSEDTLHHDLDEEFNLDSNTNHEISNDESPVIEKDQQNQPIEENNANPDNEKIHRPGS